MPPGTSPIDVRAREADDVQAFETEFIANVASGAASSSILNDKELQRVSQWAEVEKSKERDLHREMVDIVDKVHRASCCYLHSLYYSAQCLLS